MSRKAKRPLPPEVAAYFAAISRQGGRARTEKLSPERRREIGRMGAAARAAKYQTGELKYKVKPQPKAKAEASQ